MKKLIVLLLFAVPVWAQQVTEVIVRPYIFTATIDSVRLLAGSKSISTGAPVGNRFASVSIGDYVWGKGIPFGTQVVDTVTTDSVLVLSKPATVTDSSGTTILGRTILNFSYYQAAGGFANDFIGLPFEIPNASKKVLSSVTIFDSSDCVDDSLEVLLFNNPDYATTPVLDTNAVSTAEADFDNFLGTVLFTSPVRDLGAVRILQMNGLNMPMPNDKVYGRLVNRSSTRVLAASTQAFILRFRFVNN